MEFYDFLLETFGYNEPIFLSDIKYKNYSNPWISKQLAYLCESDKIKRFEKGVYYIPTSTPFGFSTLNPFKVIEKKYIKDNNNCFGFYSGFTALNKFGLTTQMPNTVEVCTNNETTKVRTIKIGNQSVVIRRSRVRITNDNINAISFLELMNSLPNGFINDERKKILGKLVADNRISKNDILEFSSYFPDRTMRNLIESEVVFNVAQRS